MAKWNTVDGWNDEWLEGIGLEELITNVERTAYAVRNCVWGTEGMNTPHDLIEFLEDLKSQAEDIICEIEASGAADPDDADFDDPDSGIERV